MCKIVSPKRLIGFLKEGYSLHINTFIEGRIIKFNLNPNTTINENETKWFKPLQFWDDNDDCPYQDSPLPTKLN